MSLDLWLTVDAGGDEPAQVGRESNITHNLHAMCAAAGVDPWEFKGRVAEDTLDELEDALRELRANPAKYRAMNPENGWGDYEGLVEWLAEVQEEAMRYPKAIWDVSR